MRRGTQLSEMSVSKAGADLPLGFYLGVPLALVLSPYVLRGVWGTAAWLTGEYGIFEILTFILLLAAIYFLLRARVSAVGLRVAYLPTWLILMLLGSAYFAGEEISWGQHFFLWQTPDAWQRINDQSETNLHNVHALFDQLPRAALTLVALVGGVLLPLYRYWPGAGITPAVDEMAGWLWPTGVCLPVCVCALLISPLDKWVEGLGEAAAVWDISGGEMKECLLALFILFYAMSLHKRLRTRT